MPIRPTFYGFEMARSAMSASQKNIDITGQNIANIGTPGFSRQRVNLSAIGPGGINWRHALQPSEKVGLGVNVDSIKRVRDQFLDARFRTELSDNSRLNIKLDVLGYVESNIDEFVGESGTLHSIMTSFQDALQDLNTNNCSEAEFMSMTRSAADKLVTTSRVIANRIEQIREDTYGQLEFAAEEINRIAMALEDINTEIRNQFLLGSAANELLDKRDLLLDELAAYGDVNTRPAIIDDVDTGGLNIYFGVFDADAPDDSFLLVSGERIYHATLEITDRDSEPVRLVWATGDNEGEDFIAETGEVFAYYEMLNGVGNVSANGDPETADEASKGIPYFTNMLNTFISEFAEIFNSLNEDENLFADNDGSGVITALNITISEEWQQDPAFLLKSLDNTDTPGAARNDNILRMINAIKEPREFIDEHGNEYRGSFLEYLGSINTEIALEISYNLRRKDTSDINLMSVDMYRASIMDVDSDEEAANLMKFQKSYNAAVRFMTTLDEMLDMVVNRMGVVGR
ncbi:MAG: flagellar hook-associated protein FlgK [Oscillospiraceae bacterium]|nr:flagellar hook-associated protein FlgK [Oscillospiraceae bacterium]